MKRSQEIQLKQSESRQRANELSQRDNLTSDEKQELDGLMEKMNTLETQYRASIQIENSEEAEQRSLNDGEGKERSSLESRARCGEYISAAIETRAVDGVEKELNEACGLGTRACLH